MNDEPEDDDFDPEEDCEIQIECPYCDGEGWQRTRTGDGTISVECAECGGTGWQ